MSDTRRETDSGHESGNRQSGVFLLRYPVQQWACMHPEYKSGCNAIYFNDMQ